MLKPGPLPRATCPGCGRSVPTRKDGQLREHKVWRQLGLQLSAALCRWSGKHPRSASHLKGKV
jgi:hypothetical protein